MFGLRTTVTNETDHIVKLTDVLEVYRTSHGLDTIKKTEDIAGICGSTNEICKLYTNCAF